ARSTRRPVRDRLRVYRGWPGDGGGSGGGEMTATREHSEKEIIYDWNSIEKVAPLTPGRRLEFFDETLRDGIQSPSVVDPKIDDKLKLVQLANDLGIHAMDLGLPGAGARAIEDVTRLVSYIRDNKLSVKPGCAA